MKWYLGAGLLLLAALILQSGLLAYAMYVLLGVLVVSRLLARSGIEHLQAKRYCRRLSAEIGETVTVTVTVRHTGWLPVPWVLVEDLLPKEALAQRPPRLRVKGKRIQIALLRGGQELEIGYRIEPLMRGYYQVGPVLLETGDVFGLHRRFRVAGEPNYLLVYPRVVPLVGYDIASRRPIGDVRLTHRLYEDPTRIAGVRPYEAGDPLNRVHWRATARTGVLHSKLYEPSTLAGATIVLDFHEGGYHRQGEPYRSELAVTAAASLANAVYLMGQQVGLVTNGRDAADRIRLYPPSATGGERWEYDTRRAARQSATEQEKSDRLRPLVVETRRGVEQLQKIRETLARVELSDGLTFAGLIAETISRLPRDATVIAVLADVLVETALALGNLRRQGYAVSVVLVMFDSGRLERALARLLAEGIRDARHLRDEASLPALCQQQVLGRVALDLGQADVASPFEDASEVWAQQTPYDLRAPEE
ncbi:MAG TPA: DUF58 domain-containing protein [Gemmataceae bacterium]|nr:DUF58 domain-containing protein [Gemmataceae bacterium]